mgnify:CR=1 FL=1
MWFIKYISCWGQYTLTLLLTGSYHSDKTSSFCVRDILSQSVSSRHYSRCFFCYSRFLPWKLLLKITVLRPSLPVVENDIVAVPSALSRP